jgi:hypothetical protein
MWLVLEIITLALLLLFIELIGLGLPWAKLDACSIIEFWAASDIDC